MKWWVILVVCAVGLSIVAGLALWRLSDHDLAHRSSESFGFEANGVQLSGTLWLPNRPIIAAVVLAHGDGPQDRFAGGGYQPLINTLLDAGIAVASWDKAGIGASQGNWLNQSMEDRAVETASALDALALRIDDAPIGALGFSQAGWVLPRLAPNQADFIVLVGPAVSWRDQGAYYTATRLRLEGASETEIAEALARARVENERLFGTDARFDPGQFSDDMNEARWAFIQRNRNEDARDFLRELQTPILAIWGENDLNVDAAGDAAIYRATLLDRHPGNQIVIVPDATHGLLKASRYNAQLVSTWPWHTVLRFMMEGRYAWAPGSLDMIIDWIVARASP
ncbi:MAG: alpha/beta hydrolase [Pseudomonadota bacterium]